MRVAKKRRSETETLFRFLITAICGVEPERRDPAAAAVGIAEQVVLDPRRFGTPFPRK